MTNRALSILGAKFAAANQAGNIAEQRKYLKWMSTIGRSLKVSGYSAGADRAAELHWNQAQPSSMQAHIEYWNCVKGQLVPNTWNGVMAHVKDADGDWICDWSSQDWCTTLDQAVNHVPAWLGGTIVGDLLQGPELEAFIALAIH